MSNEKLNPVDVLAADFAQKLKAGESPSIEEYAKRNPKYADTIRAMFPSIKMMERVSKQERTEQAFDRRTQKLTGKKKTLGDFLVRREIGRGGMGIVYEAVQQSLRRRVALKVLAPHIADSETQLKRFHREAKSAARLHHTNIVSVYGVGQADGLHFIAMQFIDGVTLQQKLAADTERQTVQVQGVESTEGNRSSPATAATRIVHDANAGDSTESFTVETQARKKATRETDAIREAARIVRDTANALAYAHEQGVQHRDIKPGNLLLDEAGTVWVTDFGLAKHESDEAATRTGDIVGTLRYMAPEQFSGREDHRSDIYSLGMTLYELITLQPAYGSMKTVALMNLKANEPPPSPKAVVRNLPTDLEIITLKACAIDPQHRYQTASEFREDLTRFLEDRPIRARRVTPVERLWRWGKRNPAIAGLCTAVVALLIATAAVFAVGNYKTGIQKQAALDNLAAAKDANTRAERNFALAVGAFEEIMVNISARGGSQSVAIDVDGEELAPAASVVTPADAELLETLLGFFDKLSQENRTDLSRKTADALARVGLIQQRLDRHSEARGAFLDSLETYQRLAAKDDSPGLRIEQARIHQHLMRLGADDGKAAEIVEHYESARALLANSSAAEVRFEMARTMNGLAQIAVDAAHLFQETRGKGVGLPGDQRFGQGPTGRLNGGPPGRSRGRWRGSGSGPGSGPGPGRLRSQAAEAVREATDILEELVKRSPTNREYRLELARAHRHSYSILRTEEAQVHAVGEAIRHLEWLVEDSPQSPLYRYELAATLCNRVTRSKVAVVVGVLKAVRIARKLVESYPGVPEYQALLATALTHRNMHRSRREMVEKPPDWKEVVDIYRDLHRRFPENLVYRLTLASRLRALALSTALTDREEASELVQEALELLREPLKSSRFEHNHIARVLQGRLNELARRFE